MEEKFYSVRKHFNGEFHWRLEPAAVFVDGKRANLSTCNVRVELESDYFWTLFRWELKRKRDEVKYEARSQSCSVVINTYEEIFNEITPTYIDAGEAAIQLDGNFYKEIKAKNSKDAIEKAEKIAEARFKTWVDWVNRMGRRPGEGYITVDESTANWELAGEDEDSADDNSSFADVPDDLEF